MKRRRFIAWMLLGLGAAILALNTAGPFLAAQIPFSDALPGYESRTAADRPSAARFWAESGRRQGEDDASYIRRLARLVSDRMVYVSPETELPTALDNWLLGPYARWRGRYEWSDLRRAVRKGGGYCSQHAIILQELAQQAGFKSRILPLSGHVVNEVLIDGSWRVVDSTFGVAFDKGVEVLATTPDAVRSAYLQAGQSAENADRWTAALVTQQDNRIGVNTRDYVGLPYVIEKAALWGVWLIPGLLIAAGTLLMPGRWSTWCRSCRASRR